MSAKLMGMVFDLDLPQTEAWVLMALVDHAEHDGTRIFPSVATVAWKTGFNRRTVQRALQGLIGRGLLVLVREANPKGHQYRPREYRAIFTDARVKQPIDRGDSLPPIGFPGVSSGDQTAVLSDDTRGDTAVPPRTVSEPSKREPSGTTGRAHRLSGDVQLGDMARAYAEGKGCTDPEALFESFRDHWLGTGKPMVDWDATWRRWVRNAHGGPPHFACRCQSSKPKPGAVAQAQRIAAKWAAEGKV